MSAEKKSSIKKVPNFRRIHEKIFAKSESVVDARKRLETRHLEFGTLYTYSLHSLSAFKNSAFLLFHLNCIFLCFAAAKKVLSKADVKKDVKLLPSDTANGTYNRFGFKLRKAEATHVILKKQTIFSRYSTSVNVSVSRVLAATI